MSKKKKKFHFAESIFCVVYCVEKEKKSPRQKEKKVSIRLVLQQQKMQFLSLRSTQVINKRVVGAVVAPALLQQTCNIVSNNAASPNATSLLRSNRSMSSSCNCCSSTTTVAAVPLTTTAVRTAMTEVRPGDWLCANCGENNFRFRSTCNLCSKPRSPNAAGGGSNNADGDVSSSSRPPRFNNNNNIQRGFGDWTCKTCNSLNFKFRTECYSCREPRSPADIAAAAAAAAANRPGGGNKKGSDLTEANMKPGDWKCTECNAINFRGRAACFTCRTPKSSSAITAAGGDGNNNNTSANSRPSPKREMKRGDWLCQSCSEHNFADRAACFRCGLPRGDAKGYEPAGGENSTNSNNKVEGRGERSKGTEEPTKEGDWMCAECGTNNFRRRVICFKCKKAKAAAVADDGVATTTTDASSSSTTENGGSATDAEPKESKKAGGSKKKKEENKLDDPLDDL